MGATRGDQIATSALYGGNADYVESLFEQYLADPARAEANYDRVVGERFDAFLRTGRRFSFIIGHPWLLKPGLRVAVGTQTTADITLAVMGNLIDSATPGAAGRVMRVADTTLRWADPLLRRTRATA